MANLISGSTGNFATAGTWKVAQATAAATAATSPTTSYTYSSTGSVLAVATFDAASFFLGSRTASPSANTINIIVHNITLNSDLATTETVINVSDLISDGNGWYTVKLANTFVGDGATNYGIGLRSNTGSQFSVFRASATANDWGCMLRQSAASGAAPTTGDTVFMSGELTGVGTQNAFTVTIDQNSANALVDVHACNYATSTWETTATTKVTLSGNLQVWGGATYNKGTSGTPIGSSVTATLAFTGNSKSVAVNAGATYNSYGVTITTTSTKLSATANAGQAVCVTVASTGWGGFSWNATPSFLVAGTVSATRQTEEKILSSIATSTSITASTNYTNAHNGTNTSGQDMRADVILLSRNNITTYSGTAWSTSFATTAKVNIQYEEFTKSGSGTITGNACAINTTTGSFSMKFCAWHDLGLGGGASVFLPATASNNITIQGCVVHNGTNINSIALNMSNAIAGTSLTFDGNFFVMMGTIVATVQLSDLGGTITNNTCIDCVTTSTVSAFVFSELTTVIGTISGNRAYSGGGGGFQWASVGAATLGPFNRLIASGCSAWRNAGSAISPSNTTSNWQIDTFNGWGNTAGEITTLSPGVSGMLITNSVFDAGAAQVSPTGIMTVATTNNTFVGMDIVGTSFGANQSYANVAIYSSGTVTAGGVVEINCYNCTLTGTTVISNQNQMPFGSFLTSHNDGNVSNAHVTYRRNGTISRDTTNQEGGQNQCWNYAPNIAANATGNGLWTNWEMPVEANATATFTVRMKKLASYNGNNPTLSIEYKGQLIVAEVAQTITTSYADYTIVLPVSTVPINAVVKVWMHCDGTNVASGQICVQAAGRTV